MIRNSMKIIKILPKTFSLYAHPTVCLLLTIVILITSILINLVILIVILISLNGRGSPFLANNFMKFVKSLQTSDPFTKIQQHINQDPIKSVVKLKYLRIRNHSNIVFSYLKMNSIRSKFDNLKAIIHDYVDILCVSKTKIDKSLPTAQCHRPYHLDISDR